MSDDDFSRKFPLMTPVKSPPALFRINGCGVSIYGKRDRDAETNTHVATWCLCFIFVPVFCLRAYRVAPARQGWYFIGREPLSRFAKVWNVALVLGIAATIGIVKYQEHASTPAYKARQQMTDARDLVNEGHIAEASKVYQTLALNGSGEAENATTALKNLLDNQCRQAPLGESAQAYVSAAMVSRRGHALLPADVADKGSKLAADRGDSDPRNAIKILDAVRPLVVDTRPIDDRRFALLKKWGTAEPTNMEVIAPLGLALADHDQAADAKKLLLPLKDKLGDGEGARVLGTILAHEGDFDGAYGLLWPYVKPRLDQLHDAEKNADAVSERLWRREVQTLKDDKGPPDFYSRYEKAGKDAQNSILREYINARLKNDPEFLQAQELLEQDTAVVPVALELGIVMLQQGQAQSNADARKKELESAEQVFLAIGGVAGETDEYRLSLGQVYYWLGKQTDGRKLFDDFLTAKGRGFKELMQIAGRMRSLGSDPEARTLSEEAYGKTSKSEEQHAAAVFRSVCYKDLDDELEWLSKADLSDPTVRADLAKARGTKAQSIGHDSEASQDYRDAIEIYKSMPRSAKTLNETALAYSFIFSIEGDKEAGDRSVDYFQQAVDLEPSDPILLLNAGVTTLNLALADVIGNQIDLRGLHQSGSMSLLGYLYADQAGRDAVVAKVRSHPGITRALSLLERAMILAPKNPQPCAAIAEMRAFTRDIPALTALEQRMRAAGLDTTEQLSDFNEYLRGEKDDRNRELITASNKRHDDLASTFGARKDLTAAIALNQQSSGLISLSDYSATVDMDSAVTLAEHARNIAPNTKTDQALQVAYLMRAARDLRRMNPQFDEYYKKYSRSVSAHYLLAIVASEPGPFHDDLVRHPDFQKSIALLIESAPRFTEPYSPMDWALLKTAKPAVAEQAAQTLRANSQLPVQLAISKLLSPVSAVEAYEGYWYSQIMGKPTEGLDGIAKIAAMGIPLPPLPTQP